MQYEPFLAAFGSGLTLVLGAPSEPVREGVRPPALRTALQAEPQTPSHFSLNSE